MNKYYVSLTKDLRGCYLVFEADEPDTIRTYLAQEYFQNGIWKLPWCAIYTHEEMTQKDFYLKLNNALMLPSKCGQLRKEMFV